MGAHKKDVVEAIENLAAIRDAIDLDRIETRSMSRTQAHVILQSLLFAIAATFAAVEGFTGHQMTGFLKAADQEVEFFWYSVAYMGGFLALISGAAAMIFARSAKMNGDGFYDFTDRHFRSFSDLSIFSDLGLKLVTLTALLAAGKSAWIAPILFLFTCDYLLQRRFVQLPSPWAPALALCSLAAAAVQLYLGSALLLWPLSGFCIISFVSLVTVIRKQRV